MDGCQVCDLLRIIAFRCLAITYQYLLLHHSGVREIPDHQEVFLSPTTLSNLIFEINEYVPKQRGMNALTSAPDIELPSGIHIGGDAEDVAAAFYHILDICDDEDTMNMIKPPRKVELKKLTAAKAKDVCAFSGLAEMTSPRKQRKESFSETSDRSTTSCHFLLVRLPEQQTDLLVFVNVPHDEFDARGDSGALAKEEDLASELIAKFAEVLDIKDWSLFGSV